MYNSMTGLGQGSFCPGLFLNNQTRYTPFLSSIRKIISSHFHEHYVLIYVMLCQI